MQVVALYTIPDKIRQFSIQKFRLFFLINTIENYPILPIMKFYICIICILCLGVWCNGDDENVSAPMKKTEQEALYSTIQDFVVKSWNGSDLYPDPCGWTPIQVKYFYFLIFLTPFWHQ